MRRGRARMAAAAFLGALAASTLLGGANVRADETAPATSSLAGYDGRAATSGLRAFYNPEGLLPTGPPVDVGAPDALSTITSGPATFARAAVADPGDIVANPDAVLTLASPDYPQGSVPPYPYRVTATSGLGAPDAESNPAPGLNAKVHADAQGSSATATAPHADAPAIANVGSITSTATTTLTDSTVEVHARTKVSGFDLLGVLKIESVVTDVGATSDGNGPPKLTGGTTVTGATFMGQAVTIDADGVHSKPGAPPSPGLGGLVKGITGSPAEQLQKAGIKVSLVGPVQQAGDTVGQLGATGVRIDLEISDKTMPLLSQLANAVPSIDSPVPGAPSPDDVLQVAKSKHLVAIDLGGASVSLSAEPGTPVDDLASDTGDLGAPLPSDTGSATLGDVSGLAAPSLAPEPASSTSRRVANGAETPVSTTGTPAASLGVGIGALALLALLVQPFVGSRLARGAAGLLSPGDADVCLREER